MLFSAWKHNVEFFLKKKRKEAQNKPKKQISDITIVKLKQLSMQLGKRFFSWPTLDIFGHQPGKLEGVQQL